MRKILYIFLLLFSLKSQARNYYISTSGNDGNSGMTEAAPWKTLAKATASYILMGIGDSILLKRGDEFYGRFIFNKGDLILGAYGVGHSPRIIGYTSLTNWTNTGGGIYTTQVPNGKSFTNLVTFDGAPIEIARYPNSNSSNKGWLINGGTVDTTKLLGVINGTWTQGEVVFKPADWVLQRANVTAFTSGTLSYVRGVSLGNGEVSSLLTAKAGYGYFFQNKAAYLDFYKEWYWNFSTKTLSIYFGAELPANHTVYMGTLDTAINCNNKSRLTIENIEIEGFNLFGVLGVYGQPNGNITVKNCSFKNFGAQSVAFYRCSDIKILNNSFTNNLSCAIYARCPQVDSLLIDGNVISNTGLLFGQLSFNQAAEGNGIHFSIRNNAKVKYNSITKSGIDAIRFQGSNIDIGYNFADSSCMSGQDHGLVYTFEESPSGNINRRVHNNIFGNPVGAPEGGSAVRRANGIYLDGTTNNVEVDSNTVYNCPRSGINLNSPSNINVHHNTIVLDTASLSNAARCIGFQELNADFITALNISNNTFYTFKATQSIYYITVGNPSFPITQTIYQTLQRMGTLNNNRANYSFSKLWDVEYWTPASPSNIRVVSQNTLAEWRVLSGFDINSDTLKTLPRAEVKFVTNPSKFNKGIFLQDVYQSTRPPFPLSSGNYIIAPYDSYLGLFHSRIRIIGNKIISNKKVAIKVL